MCRVLPREVKRPAYKLVYDADTQKIEKLNYYNGDMKIGLTRSQAFECEKATRKSQLALCIGSRAPEPPLLFHFGFRL